MASKYSVELSELTANSSHGIILGSILPGSSVLECGSSSGYMTKYMKEKLHAQVSIVELNPDDFQDAMQYACDGICANLEDSAWIDYFTGKQFDYILFADVLEHLRNPQDVLTRAVSLLKEDGTVIVSVPNIGHSDILINLLHNDWHYTPLGLLDNTHIHFWGQSNLNEFFEKAGLTIVNRDYSILPAFKTEQAFCGDLAENMPGIYSVCQREYGDVYQFIISARKAEFVEDQRILCTDHYEERHATYGKTPQCCADYETEIAQINEKRTAEINLLQQEKENLSAALSAAQQESTKLSSELSAAQQDRARLSSELLSTQQAYSAIEGAFFWRITKPFRKAMDSLKHIFRNCRPVILFWKGLKSLKKDGIQRTWYLTKMFFSYKKAEKVTEDNTIILYDAEYQENIDFSAYATDVKTLAFYLPQYHTFPENDAWWGKGFTEWTNVRRGEPRFEGHYQPRVPHKDIGYYCLEDINVLRRQAELAKQHGIYGFCFYHYWFSGKRLMEKPVDLLIAHPEIDLPFCLCWANENWTRRWDGQEQDILIKQDYTDEDDERFIRDLEKYLRDARYIRIDGKPVILIYNPHAMPDCKKSFAKWREVARELGIGEILIWVCITFRHTAESLGILNCIDAEVEFPPHNLGASKMQIFTDTLKEQNASIYSYKVAVSQLTKLWKSEAKGIIPKYYTCMLAWDNAARRKNGWNAFCQFSLSDLYQWVHEAVQKTGDNFPKDKRFIFINAWNEWGEGTYLEPDEKYGYAYINTVSEALFDLPVRTGAKVLVINNAMRTKKTSCFVESGSPRIAVQAHVFYTDLAEEFIAQFNCIPYMFDLFITTDSEEKKHLLQLLFEKQCKCTNVKIMVLPNRGRDVGPFVVQMTPELKNYDYVGHFHTKKSLHSVFGDSWRKYLFKHLLGSRDYLTQLFDIFEKDTSLGLVFPEIFSNVVDAAKWKGNNKKTEELLKNIGRKEPLPDELVFPAGNMFWARTDAIKPLWDLKLTQEDFPGETGQVDQTTAHLIERSWVYVAELSGYDYRYVVNRQDESEEAQAE